VRSSSTASPMTWARTGRLGTSNSAPAPNTSKHLCAMRG